MSAESRITELALTLPPAPPKGGIYKPVVIVGNVAYLSGHGPYLPEGDYITGKVGSELSLDDGRPAEMVPSSWAWDSSNAASRSWLSMVIVPTRRRPTASFSTIAG
mgnify:CR=1 FL=1